ncbi:glycerol uptake facilitator protein [Rhizocola hellebori]|uniref:Glycerol uptake facilitator protein n=1 Tax=Rhizocola hellebori TaxID=1392758 RepID=A0A8J3QDG5_9ACTN|nr:aquaporin [Rhizocola hellebori]GIH07610.1 glycerol uptake facilitator protein [Rhizocola hellebori]
MRKYVAEFIGTFFLTFTVCCAVLTAQPLAPLAIGAVLVAMVFAGGHISGAHFNPAVTLAVYLRGRIEARDVLPYMGAQLAAGLIAAGISRYVVIEKPTAALNLSDRALIGAVIVELLITFALAYVVLNVATSKDHPNNSFYGVAIGFTVLAGAVAVGTLSGGAFNPAVGLAVTVAGLASWKMLVVYVLATLAGGAGAGFVFRWLNPGDVEELRLPKPRVGALRTGASRK